MKSRKVASCTHSLKRYYILDLTFLSSSLYYHSFLCANLNYFRSGGGRGGLVTYAARTWFYLILCGLPYFSLYFFSIWPISPYFFLFILYFYFFGVDLFSSVLWKHIIIEIKSMSLSSREEIFISISSRFLIHR